MNAIKKAANWMHNSMLLFQHDHSHEYMLYTEMLKGGRTTGALALDPINSLDSPPIMLITCSDLSYQLLSIHHMHVFQLVIH